MGLFCNAPELTRSRGREEREAKESIGRLKLMYSWNMAAN